MKALSSIYLFILALGKDACDGAGLFPVGDELLYGKVVRAVRQDQRRRQAQRGAGASAVAAAAGDDGFGEPDGAGAAGPIRETGK